MTPIEIVLNLFKTVFDKVWEIFFPKSPDQGSGGSGDNIVGNKQNLGGVNNQLGDRIVGSGNTINKTETIQVVREGVDPRDLHKYITKLQALPAETDKQQWVLDLYYSEKIDLNLKEALLVIISQISTLVQKDIQPPAEASEQTSPVWEYLHKIQQIAAGFNFESLPSIQKQALSQLAVGKDKVMVLNAIADVYISAIQYQQAIRVLTESREICLDVETSLKQAKTYKLLEMYQPAETVLLEVYHFDRESEFNHVRRIDLREELGQIYIRQLRFNEAELMLLEAKQIAKTLGYAELPKESILKMFARLISLYCVQGMVDEAKENILEIIHEYYPGIHLAKVLQHEDLKPLFFLVAMLYTFDGEYQHALNFVEAGKKSSNVHYLGANNLGLGLLHHTLYLLNASLLHAYLGDITTSNRMVTEAREYIIDNLSVDHSYFGRSCGIKAMLSLLQKDQESAHKYLGKAESILLKKDQPSSRLVLAVVYADVANIYSRLGKYDMAEKYYQRSRRIVAEIFGLRSQWVTQFDLRLQNLAQKRDIILMY